MVLKCVCRKAHFTEGTGPGDELTWRVFQREDTSTTEFWAAFIRHALARGTKRLIPHRQSRRRLGLVHARLQRQASYASVIRRLFSGRHETLHRQQKPPHTTSRGFRNACSHQFSINPAPATVAPRNLLAVEPRQPPSSASPHLSTREAEKPSRSTPSPHHWTRSVIVSQKQVP
ncbi:hypothetical protein N657DRAFT_293059 [Parathielavia appendiculata]|uniref:Uncharacterized protein n=1 Tax=Parathielavia appendiculata TaxID=2587402 RepID=A0AAN6U5B4_9PEZI|nr:hypothetical protein N657DRAFT_293059 [Parathielavia appendiculata]